MELWRRLILTIFICSSVFFAKLADISPLVLIEIIDFAESQKKEGSYMGVRIMTEEDKRLSAMPLQQYIKEITKNRLFMAEGQDWKDIFVNLKTFKDGQQIDDKWQSRLPSGQYPSSVFFFKPDETPVNSMNKYLTRQYDEVYLSLKIDDNSRYLRLQYRTYSDDDFHFGTGFSNYPTPPSHMLFPFRSYSLWLSLLGMLIYIFIPLPKKHPHAICYPRWRIIMGDIVALLMIVPFFSFPFLIVGGSLQTFTQGWPFLIMFWPILFLGIWLMTISAWFAGFSILMMEDRIAISTYKGEREFFYRDMEFFQPVIFKPPKWLIALLWLAALSGKGSSSIGATGRAMILMSSASGSIGIRLKNGADIFINITDQMGSNALKGFERILIKLKDNGVQEKGKVREIRSMGLETVKLPK